MVVQLFSLCNTFLNIFFGRIKLAEMSPRRLKNIIYLLASFSLVFYLSDKISKQ